MSPPLPQVQLVPALNSSSQFSRFFADIINEWPPMSAKTLFSPTFYSFVFSDVPFIRIKFFLARLFCNNINTKFRTNQFTRWNFRLRYFVFFIATLFFTYFYCWDLTGTWCYSQYSHAGAFIIATNFWWNSFKIDRRTSWKIAMSKVQSLFYLCLERR